MKRKLVIGMGIILLFGLLIVLSGCANRGVVPYGMGTHVELTRKNYRVVKANAIGESSGLYFLGIIPIVPPRRTDALSNLYSSAGLSEGKAQALVNVVQERSTIYLILFSIPKLTVRADVIEFVE